MRAFDFGKTRIEVYGGLDSIGGNCVVIKSPNIKVMLDQGVNFTQLMKFYGFSIQPSNVAELREMRVLPPERAYEEIDEIYISHLHLDHLGSLNIPKEIPLYVPSREVIEHLSRSWWFDWKQQLFPETLSFRRVKSIEEISKEDVKIARVSHSAFPSFAFRVNTEDTSVLYTGDLRLTSPHEMFNDTVENLKHLSEGGVDVAVVEGTNFGRKMNYLTPSGFRKTLGDLIKDYKKEVLFVTAHPLDLEVILSIIELLWNSGLVPTFRNLYYAHLLDSLINLSGYEIERPLLFVPSTSKVRHLDNFDLVPYIRDLKDEKLAIFLPITGIKEIKLITDLLGLESEGLIHLSIVGEPSSEEWIVEEKRMANWLRYLGVTSYRIHLSGHYGPHQFRELIQAMNAKNIIPIHTLAPSAMKRLFERYAT